MRSVSWVVRDLGEADTDFAAIDTAKARCRDLNEKPV
jgi:hypothetical protein